MSVPCALLLALLSTAIALLIWFARSGSTRGGWRRRHSDYYVGLNFLLNDEPDDAVDVLLAALELHSTTLETHLALGTLLRRRGNVERALEHCQYLLDSGKFSAAEVLRIKLSLARNFLAAGLLDRAELLLAELRTEGVEVRVEALELAVSLYQREQDWSQALAAAAELLHSGTQEQQSAWALQASHFRCELAELALASAQAHQASKELVEARLLCASNVRIAFLQASVHLQLGARTAAVATLDGIRRSHREFAGNACRQLVEILQEGGMDDALHALHDEALAGGMEGRQLVALLPSLCTAKGELAALAVLKRSLATTQDLAVLAEALALEAAISNEAGPPAWPATVLREQLQQCAHYRCEQCGFGMRNLHWLCPGCGSWGMVRPLEQTLLHL